MSTPIKDMEVAWWAYLNSKAEYVALGLKEYRVYDGRMLPFDPRGGLWPTDALPAITLQLVDWDKAITDENDKDVGSSGLGYKLIADLMGSIIYRTTDVDKTRMNVETAIITIKNIVDSPAAHAARLGAPTTIEHYVVDFGKCIPWTPHGKGFVSFWEQQFKLRLRNFRTRII